MNFHTEPLVTQYASEVSFGSMEDIKLELKKARPVKPQIKELTRTVVKFDGLPYKRNPALNRKDFAVPATPTNVDLPRKKLPWAK